MRFSRTAKHLSVLLLSTLFFFFQGPQIVSHMWDHVLELGDSILNVWILAWDAHVLFSSGGSIWDAPIFYPASKALAFSEAMFGNLWITLPVHYLTHNPVLAFNVLVLVSFILGTYCVFVLVEDLTGSYAAGLISGLVFSFNPYRWAHISQIQLLPFFWAPVSLLFANRFVKDHKTGDFAGMLAALLAQYYASIYLGTMLLVLLAVFFLVHLGSEKEGRERWVYLTVPRLRTAFLTGGALLFLGLLPLGLPYLEVSGRWGFVREISENVHHSAEPLNFFFPLYFFRNYDWLRNFFTGNFPLGQGYSWERWVFLGFSPWALALTGWYFRSQFQGSAGGQPVKRFAWMALACAVLMLGPYLVLFNEPTRIPLPYLIVHHWLPGAQALRVPARFVQPLLLCLAVLGGYGIAAAVSRFNHWSAAKKTVWATIASGLFIADYSLSDWRGYKMEMADRVPPYDYLAKTHPGKPLLELPASLKDRYVYLYYQTAHWRPSLGGASGWSPPLFERFFDVLGRCPSPECYKQIGLSPAHTLVVHLDKYEEADRRSWERAELGDMGFRFAGRMGNALVWERDRVESSAKLAVSRLLSFSNPPNGDLFLFLTPNEPGRPWRNLTELSGKAAVSIAGGDQAPVKYETAFKLPSLLANGEAATVKMTVPVLPAEKTGRVSIEGAWLEPFALDVSRPAGLDYSASSKNAASGLAAELKSLAGFEEGRKLLTGEKIPVAAEVLNAGKSYWLDSDDGRPANAPPSGFVSLGALWFPNKDAPACALPRGPAVSEQRVALPRLASPGERINITGTILAPAAPGDYRLLLGMVSEHVAWFHEVGDSFLSCFDFTVVDAQPH